MKLKHLNTNVLVFSLLLYLPTFSQTPKKHLSLNVKDAISHGLSYNKGLLQERGQEKVTLLKEKDLINEQLPNINFKTGFKVLDNIHQFENGLFNKSTNYKVPRNAYEFALDAEIPIYEGGKIKNHKKIAALQTENQSVKVKMDERKLRLQIITAFFKVLHLQEQQALIKDKIREDNANIKQTLLMQRNGLVTQNEVLRTKLQLSNHTLAYSDLGKEIEIIEDKLKTMLGIEEDVEINMETTDLIDADLLVKKELASEELALKSSEELQMAKIALEEHHFEKKIVQANALPKLSAGASYGYTYPNFMFFPPMENLYRFGSVGLSLTFPISGLYKNKQKLRIVDEQHHLVTLKIKEEEENIKSDLFEAQKRYEQALAKIAIANEAIDQAKENYRIVKMKYANQLSLITELIDADNAYLGARSTLISLSIDKQLKYYQLQYRLGNI